MTIDVKELVYKELILIHIYDIEVQTPGIAMGVVAQIDPETASAISQPCTSFYKFSIPLTYPV